VTGAEISNADRAAWAAHAVTAYARKTRHSIPEHTITSGEHARELIGDLICDLLHLGDQWGVGAEVLIESGRGHYADEVTAERLGVQIAGVEL
jgi:hypothetical protein